jgi:tetratricopeptide (TPR) repeat protein
MNISDTVDLILNIIYAVLIIWVALELSAYALIRYAKKYRWAINICTALVTINPFDANAYLSRSWAYLNIKEYLQAIRSADRVITLATKLSMVISDSNLAMAYNNRGAGYIGLKEYKQAIQDFDRALELNPKLSLAHSNRGIVYSNYFKEYRRAILEYDRALELDPKYTSANYNRGITYYRLKEYQRAIENFDRTLELDPKNTSAYFGRGTARYWLKEYEQAIQDFSHVLTLDAKHNWSYHNRGISFLGLGNIQQGLADFNMAQEISPTDIGHAWMAIWSEMCLNQAGEREAEKLEVIAAVDPKHHIAYICRGVALWLRGDFERSPIEQEQAILLKPDDCDAYFWAGMACASLGHDQEAMGALEHSLALALPPALLAPLRWLEQDKPKFYDKYAKALLTRYKGV